MDTTFIQCVEERSNFSPLLSPPEYNRDFLLYLVTKKSSIGMVLVQEDDDLKENNIYYLSCGLDGPKLKYSHIEKHGIGSLSCCLESLTLHFSTQDGCCH
jgi:hypothetical protein